MKAVNIILVCLAFVVLPTFASAYTAPDPVHSPKLVKLNGDWFLRQADECIEVKLNRQGRSEFLLGNREIYIDRNEDYLYLTVKRWPHTNTYRMNPAEWGKSYVLEMVAVKPDTPPTKAEEVKEPYTGIFRRMVDCQMTPGMQTGTVDEQDTTGS